MQHVIELDEIEAMQITHRAKARGYSSSLEYLRALVAADELVMELRDDWQNADDNADLPDNDEK